ncbi:MAG: ATP-binding protein [Deltaproteobacteria bacterium]|nr:ATP-binding protein [Deltaproteobacteria bacterium]
MTSAIQAIRNRHRLRKLCDDYLTEGGFPEVVLTGSKSLKKDILFNYAKNILYQDIVPRFELKKTYKVEKLFYYLVSNISSLFTFNSLAKVVGLSDKTVKDYVGFFNDAFLLYTLERYDFSVKKQLRGPKKVYCIDNGLTASVAFSFSANIGRYLENMVFCSFLRAEQKVYYYKTKNGLEVDFFSS